MKTLAIITGTIALAVACAAIAASRQILSVNVQMVEVYASVFDGKANRVQHLQKDDFQVLEDGVRQKVELFESQAAGMNVALLIDTTGSMVQQLPYVKNAVVELLSLIDADDSVGLFTFSDRLTPLQPFTKDRNAIVSSLLKTRASGATALYDSMAQLSRDLSKSGGKKAILLFTDGRDNASVLTIESAVSTIRRIGVPIYTVAEGELLQDRAVLNRLKEISETTNGVAFEARKVEDLRDIFNKIGKDLQHLYLLGYYPTNTDPKSEWRRISVRLPQHAQFKIRAKEGYWK
jgi:Ca-activated chloride channel family protein